MTLLAALLLTGASTRALETPAAPAGVSTTAAPVPTVVAILDFLNRTGDPKLDPSGGSIAESLTTQFVKSGSVRVVERSQLASALKEITLSSTGIASAEQVQKVGSMVGAQVLIVGALSKLGNRYSLNGRVQRVADGILVSSEEVQTDSIDELPQMVQQLGTKLLDQIAPSLKKSSNAFLEYKRNPYLACTLSIIVPGSGQAVENQEYVKGGLFFAGWIAMGTFTVLNGKSELDKNNPISGVTKGVGAAAGILYLWASYDAWLTARRYNKLRELK